MISVRLKPELEVRLKRVAKMTGKTVSSVIQKAVEEHCENALKSETLDESLSPWIGCLNSHGKSNSKDVKTVFGEILEEKKRMGRL